MSPALSAFGVFRNLRTTKSYPTDGRCLRPVGSCVLTRTTSAIAGYGHETTSEGFRCDWDSGNKRKV